MFFSLDRTRETSGSVSALAGAYLREYGKTNRAISKDFSVA
jgi:hypothetical protein